MPASEKHTVGRVQWELLDEIKSLALKAGTAVIEVYSSADFGTTFKEEGSPLTLADKASNSIITDGLKRISPGIPVLSEESEAAPYEVRKAWERFWLVDPLDGTKEFIKRNGEFTVNIALIAGNLVAEGAAHLYPRFGPTMEWDTAAAQCVVEEAGGAVTDLKGQRLCYNKKELKNPFFMVSGKPPFPWQGILA